MALLLQSKPFARRQEIDRFAKAPIACVLPLCDMNPHDEVTALAWWQALEELPRLGTGLDRFRDVER
jgi:hypothetical protein